MGKLFVVIVFTLAMCGVTMHFVPGVSGHAFSMAGFNISWMMLAALGYLYIGHKLTGK
jgi:hypothetical protein